MADGFGYGGFSGAPSPFWPAPPSQYPPLSSPPFLTTHPVESYDQSQGAFDPMISHASYPRSSADWSNNPAYRDHSRSQTPSSSFYADNTRPGVCGHRGEDMFPPSGFYSSRESSSDFVPRPTDNFSDRQRLNLVPTYTSTTSTTVSTLADMLIRNSQEPFFKPIAPSGFYASTNAIDEKFLGHYHHGYDTPQSINLFPRPPVEPYMSVTDSFPSEPLSSLKTQALFDGTQTGIHLGDGRSFPTNTGVSSYPLEKFSGVQSSLHVSSVEPVNFNVLLGYGEATGHIKPVSENPDLCSQILDSPGSTSPRSSHQLKFNIKSSGSLLKDKLEGSGVSSLHQRPNTLVADGENGISESSLKNAIEDLNCDEHSSWNHFMVSSEGPSAPSMFPMGSESCGATKADNENAQSAVNYKTPFEGSVNQHSEDAQANQKPCKLQEQMFDIMDRDKKTTLLTDVGLKGSSRSNADDVSTGRSPERHVCDQGGSPSTTSSTRVSSVVNAMHNLSEVLVYECFNNGSGLKLEQLENLDKVVDNLTKCLKKITSNKTVAGESSVPTQVMHVSCPNVVNLNEAPKVVATDFQGFKVKPIDSFGFEESVDKNEMTQSIKNILASNFPDSEENHPQILLYKNLWLETEAALCSTACMARFHRIKNEISNPKLLNREFSADESTFIQEPSFNFQKLVPIVNNAEQKQTVSLIKHGSSCGNNVITDSHDAQQNFRFNSDTVDAVFSLLSRSFTGNSEQINHGKFKPDASTSKTLQQDSAASTTEDKHNDVIDRFQILKHQETNRKLKSQSCPYSDIDVIDRFQILKQQETQRKLKSHSCPETKTGDQEDRQEAASEMANVGRSSHVSDVMDRFQILKRRETEQVQKSLNSLNLDSDSDNDQPRNKTQTCDQSASMMTGHGNSQIETSADAEPSASGKGYESPVSDWEHVLKDD